MLAGEDRTKWDFFLEMKLTEFFNSISFLKDKRQWEDQQEKAAK
jgi:hypothetical protein